MIGVAFKKSVNKNIFELFLSRARVMNQRENKIKVEKCGLLYDLERLKCPSKKRKRIKSEI